MFKIFFSLSLLTFSLYANTASRELLSDTVMVWIALFALATVGIVILFVSSMQMSKVKKLHTEMLKDKKAFEEYQNTFLSDMGEDIHDLAQETRKEREQVISVVKQTPLEEHFSKIAASESKLIDTTESLIEYLRLRSKKIKIKKETFNINNMLKDTLGTLHHDFSGIQTELIFDMDYNVPKNLIGDALYVGEILTALLRYSLQSTQQGEVKLEVSVYQSFASEKELQFKITDTGNGTDESTLRTLFLPKYHDTKKGYEGLALFVAKELVDLMHGDLVAQSTEGRGNTFILTIPFTVSDSKEKRKYRLSSASMIERDVLIIDNSYTSALTIKKMFSYFRHRIKVVPGADFKQTRPYMEDYDIIVIEKSLLSDETVNYLERIKEDQNIKVIAIDNIFNPSEISGRISLIVDHYIGKPFTQEQIFEAIVDMYHTDIDSLVNTKIRSGKLRVIHEHFVNMSGVTINSFGDFKGKKILLVEDNLINQKVMQNILGRPGVILVIAGNGEEALHILHERAEEFDLVLMDINMPIMDGYMATQMIRENDQYDHLPVVALSALVLENEISKMFRSGVNGYLQKPINLGQLYHALYIFLNKDSETNNRKKTAVTYPMVDDIKGLNIKKGLANVNDNIALYKELLTEFVAAYKDSPKFLQNLYSGEHYQGMLAFCIDMKGLSGTIGAYEVSRIIEKMHASLLGREYETISSFVAEYKKEMENLVEVINSYTA